jgi:ELWxxDGT repeat protein
MKVVDIPGDASHPEGVSRLTRTSSFLFYSTRNTAGLSSLWRSAGTAAGTAKLIDFPGAKFVSVLGVFGTRAIFAVQTSTYVEIWKSDGTASGTTRIRRLNNESVAYTSNVATNGLALYFTTTFLSSGEISIWRTNGNYSGTYMIPFLGMVTSGGRQPNLTASGPYVYFTGLTPQYGTELYLIDESTSAASVTQVEQPEPAIANYPNPFNSNFTLRVEGEANQTFSVDVVSRGTRVSRTILPCNVDHVLGQSWEPGLYIINIVHNNRSTVRKIIKLK